MKCSKAAGPDELVTEHILHSHPIIITNICNLFKEMATHNVVPDDFGLGITISLVKDKMSDIANLSNYRVITLIPVVSKLFECVLLNLCDDILVSDQLQFGFKKATGCSNVFIYLDQLWISITLKVVLFILLLWTLVKHYLI